MGVFRYSALLILLAVPLLSGCAAMWSGAGEPPLRVHRLEARAMHAYHGDRPAEALNLYREIVALDPERARAWYRIGNLLAAEDSLEEAMAAFQRTLTLEPGHGDARHNLALVHIRHGAALLEDARAVLAEDDPDAVYQADRFLAYLLAGLVRSVDIAVECECGP